MPRPAPQSDKRCPLCGTTKPLAEFYASGKYAGGYSPYCRPCTAVMNKRHRNPDRDRAAQRRRYAANPEAARKRQRAAQERAKRENPAAFRAKKFFDAPRDDVASDVTRALVEELFRTVTHCQCCGRELCLEYLPREGRKSRANPAAPSLDRANNRGGYTRANIAVICWECNYRKSDLTLEDLEMIAAYIRKHGEFTDVL